MTLFITHLLCTTEFPPQTAKNIHTWAHLALATHMKAGWVSHPQVALMTLKIKAHTLKSLQLLFRLELKKPLG